MAVQRNPIAGTSTSLTNIPDSLQRNGFRISTRSREQIDTGLDWWAGETGGNQVIIYSTKAQQLEAYPSGSGDYTPVAWGSFNDLSDAKVIELINGLPGRPANTQYTTLIDAVTWLQSTNQYFMMNQDYPFISITDAAVVWDPSIPQCSGFGADNNARISQNLGNQDYIDAGRAPSTFAPTNRNRLQFNANGGTAYGTFQAIYNNPDAVMHGNQDIALDVVYSGTNGWVSTMWFKHSATLPYKIPLFCIGDPNPGSGGMILWFNDDKVYVGNAGNLKEFNYAFSSDTWYMVNVVYDNGSGEWRVYVNGNLEMNGGSASSYDWTLHGPLEIGGQRYWTSGGVNYADVTLQVGFFMIDDLTSEARIAYNYDAFTSASSINPKY